MKRRMETKLIESGELLNIRIIAEAVVRNIMKGDFNNDRKSEI